MNKNSKIVTINRVPYEVAKRGTGDIQEDYRWFIGGSITSSGAPLNPLDEEESKKLMPLVLNIAPSSQNFGVEVQQYWNNIRKYIPAEGYKMETGVNESGTPLNVDDYLLYKYCLRYGRVANSKELIAKSPFKISFYLVSNEEIAKEQENKNNVLVSIRKLAVELDTDVTKYNNVLFVIGYDALRMSSLDKTTMLNDITNPNRDIDSLKILLKVAKDEKLAQKAFVRKCIYAGALANTANTENYFRGDKLIANSIKELIGYIDAKENAAIKAELESIVNAHYGIKTINT